MNSTQTYSESELNMIVFYHGQGLSRRKIASKLNRSKSGICHVISKFESTQLTSRKKGSGRPVIFDEAYKQTICDYFERNRFATHLYAIADLNLSCSSSFITKLLNERGIHSYVVKKKPFLTQAHKQQR